jgi:hypothetical protein
MLFSISVFLILASSSEAAEIRRPSAESMAKPVITPGLVKHLNGAQRTRIQNFANWKNAMDAQKKSQLQMRRTR